MITGNWSNKEVKINGKRLSPRRSLAIRNHSPDGFNWGYGGSGPAQLALALLLEFTDENTARYLYQDFKRDVISKLPSIDFQIDERIVTEWIDGMKH